MPTNQAEAVHESEGLSILGVASLDEALKQYEERAANAPLIDNGARPRPVSMLAKIGACGGSFLGWFAGFWLSVSLFMLFITVGVASDMGVWPIAFVGLFVAVGLLVLYLAIKRGQRGVRMVRNGLLSWGVVTDVQRKVSTSRDSDGRTTTSISYDVSFMYRTPERLQFARINVNKATPITDEQVELVIHDPDDSTVVEFADLLPGGIRIDSMGNASESRAHSLLGLVPFALLLIGPLLGVAVAVSFHQ